jgi:serine/threonine protein kinase
MEFEFNTLCCPDGTRAPVIEEWRKSYKGGIETRYVLYRKNKDIFLTKDRRGFGEDIEDNGTPVDKGEIFIAYESTMLQCNVSNEDFDHDSNYIKTPPLHAYILGNTRARDSFANELSVYEQMQQHPHPGVCNYRGCIVVDGYVEGFVLEKYRCTLKEAVDEGLPLDTAKILETITNTVAHLHSLGLVHNDLNPHNILLNKDLSPVIADMESCMPVGYPAILAMGTPAWSGNWERSALVNDEIALERIQLYLHGQYNPIEP